MKLKILVAPVVFVSIVILLIWYIKPIFGEWSVANSTLDNKRVFMTSLKAKNEKVLNWKKMAEGDSESKEIINKYIPKEVKEEEIIDNLNSMAMDSGVVISDVVLTAPSDSNLEAGAGDSAAAVIETSADVSPDEVVSDNKLSESRIEVSLKAFGSYDKIKDFLNKTSSFRRFNEISSLSISANNTQISSDSSVDAVDSDNPSSDSLSAEVVFAFNCAYAKNGDNVVESINDAVFNTEALDMSVAKSISDSKNVIAKDLIIGQSGRNNPFVK